MIVGIGGIPRLLVRRYERSLAEYERRKTSVSYGGAAVIGGLLCLTAQPEYGLSAAFWAFVNFMATVYAMLLFMVADRLVLRRR